MKLLILTLSILLLSSCTTLSSIPDIEIVQQENATCYIYNKTTSNPGFSCIPKNTSTPLK